MNQEYTMAVKGPYPTDDPRLPDTPGIYIAFCSEPLSGAYPHSKGPFFPMRLLYIGKSEDTTPGRGIKGRIADHVRDDHPKWQSELSAGNIIAYSYIDAAIYPSIEIVEAAMINANKPHFNKDNKDHYELTKPLTDTLRFTDVAGNPTHYLKPAITPADLT